MSALNPNGVGALLTAPQILLIRCVNGWMVRDNRHNIFDKDVPHFVFESTASLARQLEAMIGKSEWIISTPPRDENGKFVAQKPPQP